MPRVYSRAQRQRSRSVSSFTEQDQEHDNRVTDTEDSIVLSGLVRTGEASRLRRRGAMRLDHNSAYPSILQPTIVADDSDDDTSISTYISSTNRDRRQAGYISRTRPRRAGGIALVDEEPTEFEYTLVCGGYDSEDEEGVCEDGDGLGPWTPSVLPLNPPTTSTPQRLPRRRQKKTNGCGTLVHLNAAPRARLGLWTARSAATSAVVPMDSAYFSRTTVAKIVRSACGCVREGVGCAVCGNPLGTMYTPCNTAPPTGSPVTQRTPSYPDGPHYWHPTPSSPSKACTYSFFASAVSSSPEFTFSAPRRTRTYSAASFTATTSPPLNVNPLPNTGYVGSEVVDADQDRIRTSDDSNWNTGREADPDATPIYSNTLTIFDRYVTSSPVPLSEERNGPSYPVIQGEVPTAYFYPQQANSQAVSFYQQQMQIRVQTQGWQRTEYDPDGENYNYAQDHTSVAFVGIDADGDDPSSPDKFGDGAVAWGR